MDKDVNIQDIKDKIKKFCEERDWDQFHNPKDLAIGIITEASEILEQFRFKSDSQVGALLSDPEKREDIEEEIADVLFMLLRLAQKYNVDVSEAFNRKMEKNERKYPIDKAKGSNKKYNEL